jgi:hypothetical protein
MLEVEEEERLAAAVEQAREDDRSARAAAVLVNDDPVARKVVHFVEVVVRVEARTARVVIHAAVELVRARSGRELHLH